MATGNNMTGFVPMLTESISFVTATPRYPIGARILHKGDQYVYVYAKTTCPSGFGCCVTGSTSYSVSISSVTDVDNGFLGVVQHASIPSAEYGWIIEKGRADVGAGANTALSLGNQVIMCGTTGTQGNMSRITLTTQYSNAAVFIPKALGYVSTSGTTDARAACWIG